MGKISLKIKKTGIEYDFQYLLSVNSNGSYKVSNQ